MKVTRITGSVLALTMSFVSGSEPSAASAGQLTWTIRNRHGGQAVFFSQSRSFEWPAPGRVFGLADHATHSYCLSCVNGETVCFGAWPPGDPASTGASAPTRRTAAPTAAMSATAAKTARQILE